MTDRTNREDSAALHSVEGDRTTDGRAAPLTRSSDIFFAAVETTRMPMIVTDPHTPDNQIIFANRAFLAMTGYETYELLGQNCRFLQGPDTDQDTISAIRDAIANRTEIATEILNYRKNGATFWNALFISPVYDPQGNLLYFFGSQLDVSRRRDAEEALRQAQKMEALGQLTGGIAHDFNNLLQVMTGYQELSISALESGRFQPEKLLRNLSHAYDAARRASDLTQQLLAFARKQRLEGRTLNANESLRSMEGLLGRTLGEQVSLVMHLDDDIWNCRLDNSQFEVALLNILINARDALENRSEPRVSITSANLLIENDPGKNGLSPGRYVRLTIEDNGCGMSETVRQRVLDPFFTTKAEGRGTGLGLSMVYGFVRQSGGTLSIESRENVGTIIELIFPVVDQASFRPAGAHAPAINLRGDETILVVEDRPEVGDLAEAFLEDFGYRVLRTSNAAEAIDVLRSDETIDLLFTDLIMPGSMNGVMLAREARRMRPALRCLLTTGYARSSLEREDNVGSSFEIIDKPYRKHELGQKVRNILDASGATA